MGLCRIRGMKRIFTAAALAFLTCAAAVGANSSPLRAKHGMVVSQEETASNVAADVLRDGGTAIDATVATAFALAVTHPTAGNIGGG